MRRNYNKPNEIKADQVEDNSPEKIDPPKPPKTATVVNCQRLNVRKKSTTLSSILGILRVGDVVVVKETEEDWTKVTTSSDLDGYVMTKYLKEG